MLLHLCCDFHSCSVRHERLHRALQEASEAVVDADWESQSSTASSTWRVGSTSHLYGVAASPQQHIDPMLGGERGGRSTLPVLKAHVYVGNAWGVEYAHNRMDTLPALGDRGQAVPSIEADNRGITVRTALVAPLGLRLGTPAARPLLPTSRVPGARSQQSVPPSGRSASVGDALRA